MAESIEKQEDIPAGVYEHYKSIPEDRRLYQVLFVGDHTERDEPEVVYVPLYIDPEHGGRRVRIRPLADFTAKVEVDGELVPRFKFIGSEL